MRASVIDEMDSAVRLQRAVDGDAIAIAVARWRCSSA
jgi:hypothetical protein